MSESVAARLCRAQLEALGPEAPPAALADLLWLALQLSGRDAAASSAPAARLPDSMSGTGKPGGPSAAADAPLRSPSAPSPPMGNEDKPGGSVSVYPEFFTHPFGKIAASRVHLPAAEALPQRLLLERALKPFKRRLPSRVQQELDPIATAEASAEWRSVCAVYRPVQERWFEVALLAEDSDTMHIWDTTLIALRRLLARHGAFRSVRLWHYALRGGVLSLSTASGAVAAPRTLVDQEGRRLCWFLTTGTSPLWRHPAITELLSTLGRHGPTVIVQLMPSHAWSRTLIGDAGDEVRAQMPGTPTACLLVKDPFSGALRTAPDALTVPMTSLEPARLGAWARFSMLPRWMPHPAIRLHARPETSQDPPQCVAPESPRKRIARFRSIASGCAFQLLRLLSGVPLSLPVMRLMQMGMESRAHEHLVEVMLSGLIERVTPAGTDLPAGMVEYDFLPGIREELRGSLSSHESRMIEATVTQMTEQARCFVRDYAGKGSDSFAALVHDPQGDELLLQQAREFLNISPLGARKPRATAGTDTPGFLDAPTIMERVAASGILIDGTSGLRTLKLHAGDTQQYWLVASAHGLNVVCDSAAHQQHNPLVQHVGSWFDAFPIAIDDATERGPTIRFGNATAPAYPCSHALSGAPRELEERVVDLAPGGRSGQLMRLCELALAYDRLRTLEPMGRQRTRAMQDIFARMNDVPPLSEPDLTLATQARSAGIHLAAIIALRHHFDPAHLDWLFECIAGDQAFKAVEAALTVQKAEQFAARRDRERIRDLARRTQRRLADRGYDDPGVRHLFDRFDLLGGRRHRPLRIVIAMTGFALTEYRARALATLRALGHEVIEQPGIRSATDMQSWLCRVRECDALLLLVGTHPGYASDKARASPGSVLMAQSGYREAMRIDRKTFIFVLDDAGGSHGTAKTGSDLMLGFRAEVMSRRVATIVRSPEEMDRVLQPMLLELADASVPAGEGGASPSSEGGIAVQDRLAARAARFASLVEAGATPDLRVKVERELREAVSNAQWLIREEGSAAIHAENVSAQLERWEFIPPRPAVFSATDERDSTLFVNSAVLAWVKVGRSPHDVAIADAADPGLPERESAGEVTAGRILSIHLTVNIGVAGIDQGVPALQSIAIEPIVRHIEQSHSTLAYILSS